MPDEVQPLSAAQPDPQAEQATAASATPPPAPPVKPAPAKSAGSSNRVRARLARLGVQRSNAYNPVLEPLLRIVRS
ncbi:hypothetical protein ACFXJJ_15310, partial [Streptomyces sp. NPDC059233]